MPILIPITIVSSFFPITHRFQDDKLSWWRCRSFYSSSLIYYNIGNHFTTIECNIIIHFAYSIDLQNLFNVWKLATKTTKYRIYCMQTYSSQVTRLSLIIETKTTTIISEKTWKWMAKRQVYVSYSGYVNIDHLV